MVALTGGGNGVALKVIPLTKVTEIQKVEPNKIKEKPGFEFLVLNLSN